MATRKRKASPLRAAGPDEGGHLFLPATASEQPRVMRLRHDTFADFYKALHTQMIEPIRMPGWPMGIGLIGDEDGRYKGHGLNPWLQGNGSTWDVVGPLIVAKMNGFGPLNAEQMAWALANVVKRDGTLHGLGCRPC